jgi:hypothetical protein
LPPHAFGHVQVLVELIGLHAEPLSGSVIGHPPQLG